MFFIMMLPTLLARVSPASTSAKPACMKMTSTAASRMKTLSRFVWTSAASISWAPAGPASTRMAPVATPAPTRSLRRHDDRVAWVGGACMGVDVSFIGCRETGARRRAAAPGPAGPARPGGRAVHGPVQPPGRPRPPRARLTAADQARSRLETPGRYAGRARSRWTGGGRARRGARAVRRAPVARGARRRVRAAAPGGAGRRRSGRPSTAPGREAPPSAPAPTGR